MVLTHKNDDIAVLDTLLRKRNLNDYTGDPIDAATLLETVSRAEALLRQTEDWLDRHHPKLIEGGK